MTLIDCCDMTEVLLMMRNIKVAKMRKIVIDLIYLIYYIHEKHLLFAVFSGNCSFFRCIPHLRQELQRVSLTVPSEMSVLSQ